MPAGYKNDTQRANAMKLIEPGVMKLASGKTGAPVRGNPIAKRVERYNAQVGPMNPPPPAFKKGGKVKAPEFDAEDKKAAKKAGLSKKAFEASPADKAQDKAEMAEAPGMKRGGKAKKYAAGGAAKVRKGMC